MILSSKSICSDKEDSFPVLFKYLSNMPLSTLSRSTILIIFLITFVLEGLSQQEIQSKNLDIININLQQLGINEGLSQGMVNSAVIDHDGFIWVGTKDGLNRYDGRQVKVYRHNSQDSTSIADNFINELFVDQQGRLWIGTQSKGLDLYLKDSDDFRHFREKSEELSSDFIGAILEDHLGNICVQTLDEEGFNIIHLGQPNDRTFQIDPIKKVYPCLQNAEPLGSTNWSKHLYFLNNGGFYYLNRAGTLKYWSNSNDTSSGDFVEQLSISQLPLSYPRVSLSCNHQDFLRIDENLDLSYHSTGSPKHQSLFHFSSNEFSGQMFVDSKKRVWILTKDKDFLCIDLKKGDRFRVRPNWKVLEDNAQNITNIEFEDRNGNLWIGTGGCGMMKLNIDALRFKHINYDLNLLNLRINVTRISSTKGKAVYSPELTDSWIKCSKSLAKTYPNIDFATTRINLAADENGNFWGAARDLSQNNEFIYQTQQNSNGDYYIVKKQVQLNPDDQWYGMPIMFDWNNDIWFSERVRSGDTKVYHFDRANDSIKEYAFPVTTRQFHYRFVSDWYMDESRKTIWFASTHGLFALNTKSGEWKSFNHDVDKPAALSSNMLLSICPDPHDNEVLWLGTEGFGINRLNTRTSEVEHFDITNGLPSNVIYAIQSDSFQHLWISTNSGLVQFNPLTKEMRCFDRNDGLPGNEFNRYEFSKSEKGIFCFGGVNGFVAFNPADFYREANSNDVVLSEILLMNQSISPKNSNKIDRSVEYLNHLELGPKDLMITLRFTMLEYNNPTKHEFKYKLLGFNEDWIFTKNKGEATYTNLAPGTYKFQVLGKNSSGIWSSTPRELNILVHPNWWATKLFRGIILLSVALIVLGGYRYRMSQYFKIHKMRNRIAQDLHDDIGATLSSISIYTTVLLRTNKHIDEKSANLLTKISSSSGEMLESMNDMIWSINSDHETMLNVINRMRSFSFALTEELGIELHFDAAQRAEEIRLSMEQRRNIYLIFKEAINNAIKHASCTKIIVMIDCGKKQLFLVVQDNGTGFQNQRSSNSHTGGNGLMNIEARARELKGELLINSSNLGTKIQLNCPIK
jgi:ligand-binding sensor domain-containing protein/two-component sensor histidine kinase